MQCSFACRYCSLLCHDAVSVCCVCMLCQQWADYLVSILCEQLAHCSVSMLYHQGAHQCISVLYSALGIAISALASSWVNCALKACCLPTSLVTALSLCALSEQSRMLPLCTHTACVMTYMHACFLNHIILSSHASCICISGAYK